MRDQSISAPEKDVVVRTAHHGYEVPSRDSEDVGAGDNAGTGELQGCLGAHNEVESVAGEGEVDVGVAFGLGEGSGGDEDGGVAALDEAVVEEEAERGGGGGGRVDLLVCGGFLDDLVESGAGFVVVVVCEMVS